MGIDPPAPSNGGFFLLAHPELEFFILSIAYEYHEKFSTFDLPNLGEVVNRPDPKFSRDELLETLYNLTCCGDLAVRRAWRQAQQKRHPMFVPTREEIDAALCGALDLAYGLTPQGGARWESMAQFDWSYHVKYFADAGIECTNAEMVDVYLAWSRRSVPGSEKRRSIRHWKPTYWKSLPVGVRVRYKESEEETRSYKPLRDMIPDLWLDEWHSGRRAQMRTFVPMQSTRTEPVLDAAWRRRFASMGRRSTSSLLRMLNHPDTCAQYAAGLQLAQAPDLAIISRLVDWFLERRSRFALRVVSKINHPCMLNAFIEVFNDEQWSNRNHRTAFRRNLQLAIAAFGQAAVPKLVPFLLSDTIEEQIAALQGLGNTHSSDAGTAILNWLNALKPDRSSAHYWRVKEGFLALASLADLRALPTLKRLLLGGYANLAVEALVQFNNSETRKILDELIHSTADIQDRWMAAASLATIDPSFEQIHQQLRSKGKAAHLRGETNKLISGDWNKEISNPGDVLIGMLRDEDSDRRAAAIILICRRNEDFPFEQVSALLSDPVDRVRANAAYAIGVRGSKDQISRITELAKDKSGIVRYCVQRALFHLDNAGQSRN